MQKISSFINSFMERHLSSTRQVQRIIIYAVIALLLLIGSFAGTYYFGRFSSKQKPIAETTIAQAEQAVIDNPNDLNAHLQLAETYLVYVRYGDALKQAEMVFTQDPTIQRAWLVMGIAYANNGHPDQAITPLTNYINANKDEDMAGLDPALVSAAYYLGDSYLQLNKYQDAIQPLELTVNLSQTDADAFYKLGLAYAGVERYTDANSAYLFAINFVPNFTEVYQGMAVAYAKMNEPALVDYANGMVAYSQKNYADALNLLLKSSNIKTDSAIIYTGLGLTYEALNDLQNAQTNYVMAVAIDPNSYTASRGVARVEALLKK